jgi:hypothetical protein
MAILLRLYSVMANAKRLMTITQTDPSASPNPAVCAIHGARGANQVAQKAAIIAPNGR